MSLRTDLGRVRGLGSAKEGAAHWWAQRMTAIALIPLMLWLVGSIVELAGADIVAVESWIADPVVAVLLVLLLGTAFHHAQLGLRVVIEDYVHSEGYKIFSIVLVKFAAIALAASSIFAVLKIAFSG